MEGEIASTVRNEYLSQEDESRDLIKATVGRVQCIVSQLLTEGLAAPDQEISTKVSSVINNSISQYEEGVTSKDDPLILGRGGIASLLIKAVDFVTEGSDLEIFESFGARIFKDDTIGREVRELAEMQMKVPKYSPLPIEDLSSEQKDLIKSLRNAKDRFPLDYVGSLNRIAGERKLTNDEKELFKSMLGQIRKCPPRIKRIPNRYYELMDLAKSKNLAEDEIKAVVHNMVSFFDDLEEDCVSFLLPVVFELCEIALGPRTKVKLPTNLSCYILDETCRLIYMNQNHRGISRFTSSDDLAILDLYPKELAKYVNKCDSVLLKRATSALDEIVSRLDSTSYLNRW